MKMPGLVARCWLVALAMVPVGGLSGARAQMPMAQDAPAKPMPSPPATAETVLAGKTVTVKYNAPSMRGRKIMGGLVPYGQVWRTGANPATTLIAPVDLMIGELKLPAGTYTLFTLPASATEWTLIVSSKTGEWGIPYPEGSDFGRTPMKVSKLAAPQEVMSISWENVKAKTAELHVRWETTDGWVKVTAR